MYNIAVLKIRTILYCDVQTINKNDLKPYFYLEKLFAWLLAAWRPAAYISCVFRTETYKQTITQYVDYEQVNGKEWLEKLLVRKGEENLAL